MRGGRVASARRSADDLVKALGMSGVYKSQVSRLCAEIDGKVKAFVDRRLEGDWPDEWAVQRASLSHPGNHRALE